MNPEFGENPPSSIPFISEEVREQVLEEAGINSNSLDSSLNGFSRFAETTLIDVAQVNFPFVESLAVTLRENPENRYKSNGFVKGVALVMRAYYLVTEGAVIERLNRLDEEDIHELQTMIRHGEKMAGYEMPIIERVIAAPRIPEQQVNLRQLVRKAGAHADNLERGYIESGAVVTYKFLSKNWGKLMH